MTNGMRLSLSKWGGYGQTSPVITHSNVLVFAASPIERDRTRPTVTHVGTAHALFTGWFFFCILSLLTVMSAALRKPYVLSFAMSVHRRGVRGGKGQADRLISRVSRYRRWINVCCAQPRWCRHSTTIVSPSAFLEFLCECKTRIVEARRKPYLAGPLCERQGERLRELERERDRGQCQDNR